MICAYSVKELHTCPAKRDPVDFKLFTFEKKSDSHVWTHDSICLERRRKRERGKKVGKHKERDREREGHRQRERERETEKKRKDERKRGQKEKHITTTLDFVLRVGTSPVARARTTLTCSRVVCVGALLLVFLELRPCRGLPPARLRSAWRKAEDSSTNPPHRTFPCDLSHLPMRPGLQRCRALWRETLASDNLSSPPGSPLSSTPYMAYHRLFSPPAQGLWLLPNHKHSWPPAEKTPAVSHLGTQRTLVPQVGDSEDPESLGSAQPTCSSDVECSLPHATTLFQLEQHPDHVPQSLKLNLAMFPADVRGAPEPL